MRQVETDQREDGKSSGKEKKSPKRSSHKCVREKLEVHFYAVKRLRNVLLKGFLRSFTKKRRQSVAGCEKKKQQTWEKRGEGRRRKRRDQKKALGSDVHCPSVEWENVGILMGFPCVCSLCSLVFVVPFCACPFLGCEDAQKVEKLTFESRFF